MFNPFDIPENLSEPRKRIIRTYVRIRVHEQPRENMVRVVARRLGYTLDENNTNTFVARTLRELCRLQQARNSMASVSSSRQ